MGAPAVKIAVCIKRTPDSESRFRIAGIGHGDRRGRPEVRHGRLRRLRRGSRAAAQREGRRRRDGGRMRVGPDSVQETLRKAMSMGADRAVHLKADAVPPTASPSRSALAAELKDGGYDLVLFGKHAFDSSAGVVGTATAELLGVPCVTAASELSVSDRQGRRAPRARGRGRDASSSRCPPWSRSTKASRARAIRRSRGSWRRRRSRSSRSPRSSARCA